MLKFIKFIDGQKYPDYTYTKDGNKILQYVKDLKDCDSAGIMLPQNVVVIDFDNHTQDKNLEEKLTKIIDYFDKNYPTFKVTTDNGYHLYYKKPSTLQVKNWNNIPTVYGVPVDYKNGVPITIKLNGKTRESNKSFEELNFKQLPDLPIELYPVVKSKNLKLLNADIGERDNNIFTHLLNVKETYKEANISEVAYFINNNLFVTPLTEKEIKTKIENVSSRDSKSNNYFDGKNININEFAKFLIKNHHICKINHQLYMFNGEVYVTGKEYFEALMINYIPNVLSSKRNEIYKMIELLMKNEKEKNYEDAKYIAFKNGVYNIEIDQLLDFNPDYIITNQIYWNYNKQANNIAIKNIISNWVSHDEDTRLLLEECIGMCMYRSNSYGTSFILTGDKDNGKSSFLAMLKGLLGADNYSSIGLENIDKKFMAADIVGKLANLGDDIDDKYISKTETFKKLVTGETVQLERKGKDPFYYNNYAKLIFTANDIPHIKDLTGAVIEKRIIIIPFNVTYIKGNRIRNLRDIFINEKKQSNDMMETLILIGIEGIKRVLKNDGFTESTIANEYKENYKIDNDIVLGFIKEYGEENIINMDEKPILWAFKTYCEENNSPSGSQKMLRKGIKRILNCEIHRRDTTVKEMKEKGLIKKQKIPYYAPIVKNTTK